MLLTLLIVTHVTAEWVEISQQHYRKPIRTSSYNPFTTPDKFEVEETTKSLNYNNRNSSQYSVNKTPLRHTNTGNGNRIYFPADGKPADAIRIEEHIDLGKDGFKQNEEEEYVDFENHKFKPHEGEGKKSEDFRKVEFQRNRGPSNPKTELSDISQSKGAIQRVPNIGSVKRVQLNSSPVKSPVANKNTNDEEDMVPKTRYEERPLDDERKETETYEDNRHTETKFNNRKIYLNQIRNQNIDRTSTFPTKEDEPINTERAIMKKRPKPDINDRNNGKDRFSSKPIFITEEEDLNNHKNQENRRRPNTTPKKNILTTEPTDMGTTIVTKTADTMNDKVKHRPVDKADDFITESHQRKHEKNNNAKPQLNTKEKIAVNHDEKIVQDKRKKDKIKENVMDNKIHNMENMLKFLKVVADTISQNTRRSFGGKMRYLHELKNSILANIADRIDATWPDDDAPGSHRSSRSAQVSARGHHVHFPSSESALMTISFLTFAVFLIKLVLQVIHTYKNKTMMVAPVMVAASGRSPSHGRH